MGKLLQLEHFLFYNMAFISNICSLEPTMVGVTMSQKEFLEDRQGRTFADVVNDPDCSFKKLLKFFNDPNRQRRMEESEIHHGRAPLAGVVRELEAIEEFNRFLSDVHNQRTRRFRQTVGLIVRMIMERRGWSKTGRKGSLGVRASRHSNVPEHNTGGLAFWFIRAERYELSQGMPYRSTRERYLEVISKPAKKTRRGRKAQA